jgi:hypothetical protein
MRTHARAHTPTHACMHACMHAFTRMISDARPNFAITLRGLEKHKKGGMSSHSKIDKCGGCEIWNRRKRDRVREKGTCTCEKKAGMQIRPSDSPS